MPLTLFLDTHMASAVRECLKSLKVPTGGEIQEAASKRASVARSLQRAIEKKKNLLGFEKSAASLLEEKIAELRKDCVRLEKLAKFGTMAFFDLRFLKLRDQRGMPQLAFFGLGSPKCEFVVVRRCRSTRMYDPNIREGYYTLTGKSTCHSFIKPNLPKSIRACYTDILERMVKNAKKQKGVARVVAEATGILPEGVRDKIKERSKLFKSMFIIAEPNGWNSGKARPASFSPVARDAILVGFDGEGLRVIDSFTLVPVDQYLNDGTS